MSSETSDAMLSFFVSVAAAEAALTEGLGVAEAMVVERRYCCCCFEYSILVQDEMEVRPERKNKKRWATTTRCRWRRVEDFSG